MTKNKKKKKYIETVDLNPLYMEITTHMQQLLLWLKKYTNWKKNMGLAKNDLADLQKNQIEVIKMKIDKK